MDEEAMNETEQKEPKEPEKKTKSPEKAQSPESKQPEKAPVSRLSYDEFVTLERNLTYFPTANPLELMALAPEIRAFFLEKLSARPYEEEEFFDLMDSENLNLSGAFSYIHEQVDFDGENFESCRRALEMITEGIEVRLKDGNNYLGLASKLDSV